MKTLIVINDAPYAPILGRRSPVDATWAGFYFQPTDGRRRSQASILSCQPGRHPA